MQLPDAMPDGSPWPRITVVTPSYNQGGYIEETIRSVLLQGYPNLEYIVIDGGSTDETLGIIRKYERWLASWVSESDRGQSHAINKGLQRSTGEYFNWLNSDDVLARDALAQVALRFADADCLAGTTAHLNQDGTVTQVRTSGYTPIDLLLRTGGASYQQPSTWMRRKPLIGCGGVAEHLHYSFDREMTIRYLLKHPRVMHIDAVLAWFRHHPESKTDSLLMRFRSDHVEMLRAFATRPEFGPFRAACLRRARLLERRVRLGAWRCHLETLRERHPTPLRQACAIALGVLCQPRIALRSGGGTLAALRGCWTKRGHTTA